MDRRRFLIATGTTATAAWTGLGYGLAQAGETAQEAPVTVEDKPGSGLDGDLTDKQFSEGRWKAAEVLALAQKVKAAVGQSMVAQMPGGHGTIVEIRLNNGQSFKESVPVPEGDAERPMSQASMEHKFRQFADPVLGENGAKKVVALVGRLEEVKNIREFTEALRTRT